MENYFSKEKNEEKASRSAQLQAFIDSDIVDLVKSFGHEDKIKQQELFKLLATADHDNDQTCKEQTCTEIDAAIRSINQISKITNQPKEAILDAFKKDVSNFQAECDLNDLEKDTNTEL